jgi:hypothetical protein
MFLRIADPIYLDSIRDGRAVVEVSVCSDVLSPCGPEDIGLQFSVFLAIPDFNYGAIFIFDAIHRPHGLRQISPDMAARHEVDKRDR